MKQDYASYVYFYVSAIGTKHLLTADFNPPEKGSNKKIISPVGTMHILTQQKKTISSPEKCISHHILP
jgi:hypothetical protein